MTETTVKGHLEGDTIRYVEECRMLSPCSYEDGIESLLGDTKRRVSQPGFERIDLLLPAKTIAVWACAASKVIEGCLRRDSRIKAA